MSEAWLPALNFERTGNLIGAINSLAIHHKLLLAGQDDSIRAQEALAAAAHLRRFLERVIAVANSAGVRENLPTVGADPRLANLIAGGSTDSGLGLTDLANEVLPLLDAGEPVSRPSLITALGELRGLLERQVQADAAGIIGEV